MSKDISFVGANITCIKSRFCFIFFKLSLPKIVTTHTKIFRRAEWKGKKREKDKKDENFVQLRSYTYKTKNDQYHFMETTKQREKNIH